MFIENHERSTEKSSVYEQAKCENLDACTLFQVRRVYCICKASEIDDLFGD